MGHRSRRLLVHQFSRLVVLGFLLLLPLQGLAAWRGLEAAAQLQSQLAAIQAPPLSAADQGPGNQPAQAGWLAGARRCADQGEPAGAAAGALAGDGVCGERPAQHIAAPAGAGAAVGGTLPIRQPAQISSRSITSPGNRGAPSKRSAGSIRRGLWAGPASAPQISTARCSGISSQPRRAPLAW